MNTKDDEIRRLRARISEQDKQIAQFKQSITRTVQKAIAAERGALDQERKELEALRNELAEVKTIEV